MLDVFNYFFPHSCGLSAVINKIYNAEGLAHIQFFPVVHFYKEIGIKQGKFNHFLSVGPLTFFFDRGTERFNALLLEQLIYFFLPFRAGIHYTPVLSPLYNRQVLFHLIYSFGSSLHSFATPLTRVFLKFTASLLRLHCCYGGCYP